MTGAVDVDVAIVGYGPVGQALAAMLGKAGHRVAVFERWPNLYPLSRACVVDHEAMRTLQGIGAAEEFSSYTVPSKGEYIWLNAEGQVLYHFKYDPRGISGWPSRSLMYQPDLEQVLDRTATALPNVKVHMGWQVAGLRQTYDGYELTAQAGAADAGGLSRPSSQTQRVTARRVVGADGANSFVRQAMGIELVDLGFRADWLVVDFQLNDPAKVLDMPEAGQICDPARPVTVMRHLGLRHARWEMMLLPGEDPSAMTRPEAVWPLLERWVGPSDGVIERAAVYTFKSAIAQTWSKGAVSLAGDAAHLMPPFLGQGLCSGLRDALGLSWRLDLILRGIAGEDLLESYEVERKAHVAGVIDRAVALGRVVCITNPEEAARRDVAILGGQAPPLPLFPKLAAGLLGHSPGMDGVVGELSFQGRVSNGAHAGRFDDVVGKGWQILTLDEPLAPSLSDRQRSVLKRIGARMVAFGAAGEPVQDIDGDYRAYMDALGVRLLIIRPDFYVFGAAKAVSEGKFLIDQLEAGLKLVGESAAAADPIQ
jgi:2-polyprenyl-6-methoxyphenol hydroxylase-like FAD-dependent oxidoreductase